MAGLIKWLLSSEPVDEKIVEPLPSHSPDPNVAPPWAAKLSEDLNKAAIAFQQMALSDELRKDVIQANDRMARERRSLNERFEALQQFVETGRACADCRATRQMILERMKDVITKNNRIANYSMDAGNGYATRTAAFHAGWELAFNHLKNVLVDIEKSI